MNDFLSLADAISKKIAENNKPRFHSQRSELLNELYSHYEESWKKNTWTNYINWLKNNRFKNTPEKREEFKKSKDYWKKDSVKTFCSYRVGFIPTNDLYYIISIARDKNKRGENFNQWLFWAINPKNF